MATVAHSLAKRMGLEVLCLVILENEKRNISRLGWEIEARKVGMQVALL